MDEPLVDILYTQNWDSSTKFSIKVTRPLHTENTPYQRIDFFESETYGTFFTLDGLMMVTQKDEFAYHDMIVHVPMATNPDISRVLIVGGGDGGTSREVCRYKHIKSVDLVELDERVMRLCQQYLPQTAGHIEKEERLHLHFQDGYDFIKNAPDGAYDLILVDSTDPIGYGEGLFTIDFYRECYRVLSEDGILINQHESPYYNFHVKEMRKAHRKIKAVFPIARAYQYNIATYPSGHWLFGFASKKYDPIRDHQAKRWEEFGLKTMYYNSQIHEGAFALPTYVNEMLEGTDPNTLPIFPRGDYIG